MWNILLSYIETGLHRLCKIPVIEVRAFIVNANAELSKNTSVPVCICIYLRCSLCVLAVTAEARVCAGKSSG